MQETHIASAFDRDLRAIEETIMEMGKRVEEAIGLAARALEEEDIALAQEVRKGDREIDALEEKVNADATRLIALRAPTAGDLRTVVSVFKISGNLERCGDYAKNMAKRTEPLVELGGLPTAVPSIRRMSKEVGDMLGEALRAHVRRDAAAAEAVILRDREVDQLYNTVFRELLTHMMENPRAITPAMHLHFIAKNVERIGDHITSISEQTIYLVTGTLPDDDRPKGDRTPFVSEA